MPNYYEILGVDKTATQDQIKDAWKNKIKECHPDIGGDEEKAKQVNVAYSILSDPQERAAYDNPPQQRGNGIHHGFPPGFNPFGNGMGGVNINLNDLFERMSRGANVGGNQSFHFSTQTQINQEVNVSLLDAILENEIEIDAPAIGKKIKFKIPADFKSGSTYTIRIGDDKAKNQGVIILQMRMNLVIPQLSAEKKEKLKEVLS